MGEREDCEWGDRNGEREGERSLSGERETDLEGLSEEIDK